MSLKSSLKIKVGRIENMFKCFYPSEDISSAYDIDYEKYYKKGYRAIIYDIDNTLVKHNEPATLKAKELFDKLRRIGYKMCVVSNNKEPRVADFAHDVDCEYVFKADKPSKKGYVAAMEKMGSDIGNTFFVGDQLFTDVWGANRSGIHSILVKPINPKEEIQIILKRIPEKLVLYFYKKSKKYVSL